MADVFENQSPAELRQPARQVRRQLVDVPDDRKFLGFDAYKKAMDCLKPGDVAILATPPAFRWVHFTYAIEKGLNVFMEKPVTVDGPTTRRMIDLAAKADQKNLKVGVGLMIRHCRGRQAAAANGSGRARSARSSRCGPIAWARARIERHAPAWKADAEAAGMSELLYQIQRFHSFLWASGGVFSDFYIHQIDECSWMKGAWPVKAHASAAATTAAMPSTRTSTPTPSNTPIPTAPSSSTTAGT